MAATIKDVAKRAGVSISTVSRVLNDTVPVDSLKRQRVLEAAKLLGYIPNPAARSLLNKKVGAFGVLLPHVRGEFFPSFLSGIDDVARADDKFIFISCSHYHATELVAALKLMYRRVDGFIIMSPSAQAGEIERDKPRGVHSVYVNTQVNETGINAVNFDNFGGAYSMTKHMTDLGHKRIAHITGASGAIDAQLRLDGYKNALMDAGIPFDERYVVRGDFTRESGWRAGIELINMDSPPTAVFAANDESAFGAIKAFRENNISIPDDIAVGGFDDVPSSTFMNPALTTVHVPVYELGALAMRRLITLSEGAAEEAKVEFLSTELVVRHSTVKE